MLRVLATLHVTLTLRSRSYNVLSCKSIFSLTVGRSNFKFCRCKDHMIWKVLYNILCDLKPIGQGHIMYFLVNASPP